MMRILRAALVLLLCFMLANPAWGAAFTSKADGNWTATGQTTWNEVGIPGVGDTVSIATTHDITLDQTNPASVTCTSITIAGTGTLVIPASTSFTITANITNNGTATSGAIVVATGKGFTVVGTLTNTSSGYAVVMSAGTVNCQNVSNSGTGRCISDSGGTITGIGTLGNTSTGIAVMANTGGSWTGDITAADGTGLYIASGSGTFTYTGVPGIASAGPNYRGYAIAAASGTVNWTGSSSPSVDCFLQTTSNATLSLNGLVCANSGRIAIWMYRGTFSQGTGTITNQSSTAQATLWGNGTLVVIGPTLPNVANVWYGSGTFGYAGGPLTPTKRASSITNCTAANVRAKITIDDVLGTYVRPPLVRGRR